jgi:hypothetical protein
MTPWKTPWPRDAHARHRRRGCIRDGWGQVIVRVGVNVRVFGGRAVLVGVRVMVNVRVGESEGPGVTVSVSVGGLGDGGSEGACKGGCVRLRRGWRTAYRLGSEFRWAGWAWRSWWECQWGWVLAK